MTTWMVGILLALLLALALRSVLRMIRSGRCAGCCEKECGACRRCQAAPPPPDGRKTAS